MPNRSLTTIGGSSDTTSIMAVFRALRVGNPFRLKRFWMEAACSGLLAGRPGSRNRIPSQGSWNSDLLPGPSGQLLVHPGGVTFCNAMVVKATTAAVRAWW
jgi:hypothetical protein